MKTQLQRVEWKGKRRVEREEKRRVEEKRSNTKRNEVELRIHYK